MPAHKRSPATIRKCLVVLPKGPVVASTVGALESAELTPVLSHSETEALTAVEREDFTVVIVSQLMGPVAISSLIARSAQRHPEIPVIVLGSSGAVQDAIDAMQLGASDYLIPPLQPEVLRARVAKLTDHRVRDVVRVRPTPSFSGLVGSSPAVRRVLTTIAKISRYKTNVLVRGESGTGKELVARALHSSGPRRQHLFVPINCATLGKELLENELFGHEKGAFTGAVERKKGIMELADGGTLFLDEIAEMDPSTQAKLLRVLERNEFRRVGGTEKVMVDLSVVAATNRNLEDAIRLGKFREDLFYRLKVVSLIVPPLRDRKEDIPALIETFIDNFNNRNGGKIRGMTPEALKRIMEYDWPGNVRELKNAVESAAILASGETIDAEGFAELAGVRFTRDREPDLTKHGSISFAIGTTMESAEKELIAATLAHCGTRRAAAAMLGLGLRTLYSKLDRYHLDSRRHRRSTPR